MIPCAKKCKYQTEGYCNLKGKMIVTSLKGECPHFKDNLDNQVNSLSNSANINKLNS